MSEDRDDEIVEAEVLDEARRDVREGYGRPTLRPTLRDVLRRPAEGGLWAVQVVQTIKVRAKSADEAESIAVLMSGADRVLEVAKVDEEKARNDAFEQGANE